jgi:hypothetical protein
MTDGRGHPDALDDFSEFTGRFMGGPQADEDYEPAPLEFSLAQARAMLSRLYGAALEHLPATDSETAPCEECGERALLLPDGRFTVCRPCALRRRRATFRGASAAPPGVGAGIERASRTEGGRT